MTDRDFRHLLERVHQEFVASNYQDAINFCMRVLEISPQNQMAIEVLSACYSEARDWPNALKYINLAMTAMPEKLGLLHNAALIAEGLGRSADVIIYCDRILDTLPGNERAYLLKGRAFRLLGQLDEALCSFTSAIDSSSSALHAYLERADTYQKQRDFERASEDIQSALRIRPTSVDARIALGNLHLSQHDFIKAEDVFDGCLKTHPSNMKAVIGKSTALRFCFKTSDSIAILDDASAEGKKSAEWHNAKGLALHADGRTTNAISHFSKAIQLEPNNADYQLHQSLSELRLGKWLEGFNNYEARRKTGRFRKITPVANEWDGDIRETGKLLLYWEQGYGDVVQFSRFATDLVKLGQPTILEIPKKLCGLLSSLHGVEVVADNYDSSDIFAECPLMSLPRILGIQSQNRLAAPRYLSASPELVKYWKSRLSTRSKNVGLVWQGKADSDADIGRSIPLTSLKPLLSTKGISFLSLQKGTGSDQLALIDKSLRPTAFTEELDTGPDAFADSAAIIENLDLVITCDTAIAHLAGALGRPVWTLLQFSADWRWLEDADTTPWYPKMKLYRQSAPGDWSSAISAVHRDIKDWSR